MARIDCHRCRHYFVTWDEHHPHGCRGMGFKSRSYPGDVVRQTMAGAECRMFEPKGLRSAHPRPHNRNHGNQRIS